MPWSIIVPYGLAFLICGCAKHGSVYVSPETNEQARRSGFAYHFNVARAEKGDQEALGRLMRFSTDVDAAGALGHGAVLVELLYRQGDWEFAAALRTQSEETRRRVAWCLEAGEAYMPDDKRTRPLASEFPLTFSILNNGVPRTYALRPTQPPVERTLVRHPGCQETMGSYFIEAFCYFGVDFGPMGTRFIERREPQDMVKLDAWLSKCPDSTQVTVRDDGSLPLRDVDYATLVAECVVAECAQGLRVHGFGPGTSYEVRDARRLAVHRALFGEDLDCGTNVYQYRSQAGEDLTKSYQGSPGWP